jgi:hypothetical protein
VPYFEIAELREIPDVSDPVKFPDARLAAARAWIEAIIERHVGTSFVDRVRPYTFDGDGQRSRLLPGYARSIVSVMVDGAEVTGFTLSPTGRLTLSTGSFTYGIDNVTVTYVENATPAGVPEDLKWAALEAARYKLKERDSRISSRTLSEFDGEGGTTRFAMPGLDRPTGLPDVDAVINGYRAQFRLPAIA